MKPHETTRYSEAFKQQVVAEVAAGKFRGLHAAAKAYGIGGATTVQSWLRRYGRADLMPRQITITTMKEQDEKKALKEFLMTLSGDPVVVKDPGQPDFQVWTAYGKN